MHLYAEHKDRQDQLNARYVKSGSRTSILGAVGCVHDGDEQFLVHLILLHSARYENIVQDPACIGPPALERTSVDTTLQVPSQLSRIDAQMAMVSYSRDVQEARCRS